MAKKKKRSVLNKIVHFFINSSNKAYLVGGVIRDIILKHNTKDIDIVVEGNAIKTGYELNKMLNGTLQVHKEFGTVSILKENMRIDLATARKEIYQYPGALPTVFKSNIIEDLKRRDFTINAIALSISKEHCGKILDPFDGIGDIRKKLVRILHKKSFIDDPTRIFRALRYKNRLNFKLEKNTENLINDAISKKMLEKISKQRIMNELKLVFAEKSYQKILADLIKYKIFNLPPNTLQKINKMGSLKYYYFLSLIGAENFPLSSQEKKIISDLKTIEELRKTIKNAKTNSALFYIINKIDEKVINEIPKIFPDLKRSVRRYYLLKKIKPLINGEDLKKIGIRPGSDFKRILSEIYQLQLDGKIKNKKTALSYIKNA